MTRVLLVCTGNICRSPLAEVIMRGELEQRAIDEVHVMSAGTGAWEGAPASEGAYLIALEHGLDLSGHCAQLVTRDLVRRADVVLTMARHHLARVLELGGEHQTYLLAEYAGHTGPDVDVSDPFGSDLDVYRETFERLDELVRKAVDRLLSQRADADYGS